MLGLDPQAPEGAGPARGSTAFPRPLHPDLFVVAEPDRTVVRHPHRAADPRGGDGGAASCRPSRRRCSMFAMFDVRCRARRQASAIRERLTLTRTHRRVGAVAGASSGIEVAAIRRASASRRSAPVPPWEAGANSVWLRSQTKFRSRRRATAGGQRGSGATMTEPETSAPSTPEPVRWTTFEELCRRCR